MRQPSGIWDAAADLGNGGFDLFGKSTRRAAFLGEMDQVVPWQTLCALIEPVYPKPGNGRPPVGRGKMLTVAVTAIARELAGFIWAIGRMVQAS